MSNRNFRMTAGAARREFGAERFTPRGYPPASDRVSMYIDMLGDDEEELFWGLEDNTDKWVKVNGKYRHVARAADKAYLDGQEFHGPGIKDIIDKLEVPIFKELVNADDLADMIKGFAAYDDLVQEEDCAPRWLDNARDVFKANGFPEIVPCGPTHAEMSNYLIEEKLLGKYVPMEGESMEQAYKRCRRDDLGMPNRHQADRDYSGCFDGPEQDVPSGKSLYGPHKPAKREAYDLPLGSTRFIIEENEPTVMGFRDDDPSERFGDDVYQDTDAQDYAPPLPEPRTPQQQADYDFLDTLIASHGFAPMGDLMKQVEAYANRRFFLPMYNGMQVVKEQLADSRALVEFENQRNANYKDDMIILQKEIDAALKHVVTLDETVMVLEEALATRKSTAHRRLEQCNNLTRNRNSMPS